MVSLWFSANTYIVEFVGILILFIMNLLLFFMSFPIINLIEIKKDYTSSPIFSLSSSVLQPSNFISTQDFTSFAYYHNGRVCNAYGKQLREEIILDNTTLSPKFLYNLTYASLITTSVKEGEPCPEGYKKCGILDSLNNTMCLETKSECPINLIVIDTNEHSPIEYPQYKFTTINLNSKYLHYTNEATDNHILVKFALNSTNSTIDIVPVATKEKENLGDYDYYTCTYLKEPVYNYTLYKTIYTDIFYRSYIGVSKQCREEYMTLETMEELFDKIWSKSLTCMIIACVLILYLFVLIATMVIMNVKNNYTVVKFLITRAPYFAMCIPIFVLSIQIKSLYKPFEGKTDCYDETTNFIINYFSGSETIFFCYFNIISIPIVIIEELIVMILDILASLHHKEEHHDTIIEARTIDGEERKYD